MLAKTISWLLLTSIFATPAFARDPANPDATVPPAAYRSIVSGTKSYRPVEPLPWGGVNRRVMPPDAVGPPAREQGKAAPKAKDEKSGPHGQH